MGRFFRRGISQIEAIVTVADYTAPTALELAAGVSLGLDLAEITGFELTNSPIPTPNLENQFTPQIEGEDTVPDSALVFYDRTESETIRTTLAKGTAMFLAFYPYGKSPAAGDNDRMELWPVKSNGVNDAYTVGNEAARFTVPFSISEVPAQTIEIPS